MARGPWPAWLALLPLLAAVAWGQAGGHPDDLDVRAQTALRLGSLGLASLAADGGYPAIYEPGAPSRRLDAAGQPLPAG
ncbi:MAG TPA: hypothetical protein DCZ72_04705, partial [Armatimonadetes bacterium]|nr:hypothetical protein [Armatimonadota bacterium]